ncbi:MAG: hypothetical protein U1E10_18860 [Bdellovibrionales bacterium]|nr:hypothetical protein [Bdellovibrionales bacterium]
MAGSLFRAFLGSIAMCSALASPLKAAPSDPLCALDYATFFKGQQQPLRVEGAIDYLVQFDSTFRAAKDGLRSEITSATLPQGERLALLQDFQSKVAAIDSQYESLTNRTLEWSVEEARREFPSMAEGLRRAAENSLSEGRTALRREQGASFNELADNPDLISPRLSYEVPQPSSSTGVQSANKLSVKFNAAVIEELRKDPHSASRFLRSMVKGYVGAHGGDGILRITDQHEALVEIKFVSKGNSRLIGCRRAGGLIEILRYYEKHNEGTGGSLKRFAKLCDE